MPKLLVPAISIIVFFVVLCSLFYFLGWWPFDRDYVYDYFDTIPPTYLPEPRVQKIYPKQEQTYLVQSTYSQQPNYSQEAEYLPKVEYAQEMYPDLEFDQDNMNQEYLRQPYYMEQELLEQNQSPYICPTNMDEKDAQCKLLENQFKEIDPNAAILPGIGLPSQNNGVCTLTHGMGKHAQPISVNGLVSKSPLANNALFSTECVNGKTLNLYEMMLPEGLTGNAGEMSNVQQYVKELNDNGISVAGTHFHWWASNPYLAAIHHQNAGMDPLEFSQKTINALNNYAARM